MHDVFNPSLSRRSPVRAIACSEPLENRLLCSAAAIPKPDHVVVVIEEDHSYSEILGDPLPVFPVPPDPLLLSQNNDPYLRALASTGASLTQMHSIGHRNAQTYQALFSGAPRGRRENPPYNDPNLASELIASGLTFGGYSESLPRTGYSGGDVGDYKRAHNPWVDCSNVPAADNLPFSTFPHDFGKLPTVSFVVPNLQDNMHSGFVSTADDWLSKNIGDYASWAVTHNSLLIVTWDESHSRGDQVPTIFFGPRSMIEEGPNATSADQFNLLSTIEGMYGLAPTGNAASAAPINVFGAGGVPDPVEDAAERIKSRQRRADDAPPSASISGSVLQDVPPGHNSRPRERPLRGWWVYLDTNNDGGFESSEPFAVTNRRGRFVIRGLAAGSYVVRVVQQDGHSLLSPRPGSYDLTLSARGRAADVDFAEE